VHDPEFRGRFIREARAQASLESTHVVAVYAHGEEDGYLYIASQLVVDGDLGGLIRTAGVPPLRDALDVIAQVASGLSDAHEAGLIHRDIKPGNVLVRIRGGSVWAYLADFGIARRMDASVTRTGSLVVGTPSYMAPELHGGAPASVATDIYSLGCVLWVALSGTTPYQGTSDYQVIGGHIGAPVPQLPGTGPLEQAANRILRIAMAKEPGQRYASAAAMRADLQAALRLAPQPGGATNGRLPTTPPPAWRPPTAGPAPTGGSPRPGRARMWAGLSVAAVLAVTVGVGAALAVGDDGGRAPTDPAESPAAFVDQPAADILLDSEKEMKVLTAAHIQGTFLEDGSRLMVDFDVTSAGDCHGTLQEDGAGRIEVLRVDGHTYVKPDQDFLISSSGADADPSTAQLMLDALHGRWLEFGKGENGRSLTKICDLDRLQERDGREGATASAAGTVTVNGKETVKIELTEGSNWEAYYVALDEPHYTLRIDESRSDSLDYSSFNDVDRITRPATDDSATLDDLLAEITG
jgi:hypothetical protein